MEALLSITIGLELIFLILMKECKRRHWGMVAMAFCCYPLFYQVVVIAYVWCHQDGWLKWIVASVVLLVLNVVWVRRQLIQRSIPDEVGLDLSQMNYETLEEWASPANLLCPSLLLQGRKLGGRIRGFIVFIMLYVGGTYCYTMFYWLHYICGLHVIGRFHAFLLFIPSALLFVSGLVFIMNSFNPINGILSESKRLRKKLLWNYLLWSITCVQIFCAISSVAIEMMRNAPGMRYYNWDGSSRVVYYAQEDSVYCLKEYSSDDILLYQGEFEFTGGRGSKPIRSGKGTCYWTDGTRYEGEWSNGGRCGSGIVYFPDGTCYVGQWKNSFRHGKGRFYYCDGFMRYMKYDNGEEINKGRSMLLGQSAYVGFFLDDNQTGQGRYYYANGGYYEGCFSNGRFNGMGKLFDNRGKLIKSGKWRNKLPLECEFLLGNE